MSFDRLSAIGFENAFLVQDYYERYLKDPNAVLPSWRDAFTGKEGKKKRNPSLAFSSSLSSILHAFRTYGHLAAHVNCLEASPPPEPAELHVAEDGNRLVPTHGLLPSQEAPLSELLAALKAIYCGKIGFEYTQVKNPEIRVWLQKRIETPGKLELSIEQKKKILEQLNQSELFELFLHKNYTGQKRFSLEGAETLIPMLSSLIYRGAELGYEEFFLGMAHRGRLNVLSNILNKSYQEIFSEFEEGYLPDSFEGSGDVKYHKGFFSELLAPNGKPIKVALTSNPSHLESVYPVVEGQVRARQVQLGDEAGKKRVLPLVIHGDAAFAGQGVDYETLQMHALPGYATGGTLHLVINNQIGFTTSPQEGRSTRYCTDLAHTFGAPVFHVNAEEPEACVAVTLLALELRHTFGCDVFIDLNCYRKFGHNETDEPAFTQPLHYQAIRQKRPIRSLYLEQLMTEGVLEKEVAESLERAFEESLHAAKQEIKSDKKRSQKLQKPVSPPEVFTGVSLDTLSQIAKRLGSIPEDFQIHPKLQQLLKTRLEMVQAGKTVDWGTAEQLALGSLLWGGTPIRLTGQDSCRGTFSHRHALWVDQENEAQYVPLAHLKEGQGRFDVLNSPLSEYAALGFEFGYSSAYSTALVIWEAQFGDFCNGAQVIIDQYLTTAEQKWGLQTNLVLLLPHGYEGQGPEHSSARIERFLTLCGHDNLRVVNPTTPSQFFHLLRRQALDPKRVPLIVFTPKGLLRHSQCVSPIESLTDTHFFPILNDPENLKEAKRLFVCSGRIYYDLIEERQKREDTSTAIIRLEQLYPLDLEALHTILKMYPKVQKFYWVQEEPENMGAWSFVQPQLQALLKQGKKWEYVGRERSASPATGSHARHVHEHSEIMQALFGTAKRERS